MGRRRALISVSDKTGVVGLAAGLIGLGWDILASRGTAAALADEGLAVTDISDHTGYPPLLGHRVVTLHPLVHGGILADSEDPVHAEELDANQISLIDLVVVNLYPFETEPSVETIDIGGPALLRAAAKNHARVGAVADPADYPAVLSELAEHGRLSDETRLRLARTAFARTQAYDTAVTEWLNSSMPSAAGGASGVSGAGGVSGAAGDAAGSAGAAVGAAVGGADAAGGAGSPLAESSAGASVVESSPDARPSLPDVLHIDLEKVESLRYGENPHQRAARYRRRGSVGFFDRVVRRGGRSLSYLNLADAAAAWNLACDLGARHPAAVIVKHANPCGAAMSDSLADAYALALECDSQSAFGGGRRSQC